MVSKRADSSWRISGSLHPAKCGGSAKYSHLTSSFLLKPECIYHIPNINHAHLLLKVITREEKVSFVITAITMMGLIQCDHGIVGYISACGSEWLIIKVDHLNTINW